MASSSNSIPSLEEANPTSSVLARNEILFRANRRLKLGIVLVTIFSLTTVLVAVAYTSTDRSSGQLFDQNSYGLKTADEITVAASAPTQQVQPERNYQTEISKKESFKFDIAHRPPDYEVSGGSVRTAHARSFPRLSAMGAYYVTLQPNGLRIPHWHPDCNELSYVISGHAEISIGSPSVAATETQEQHTKVNAEAGDLVFIPRGWLHYIKNTSPNDSLVVLVVFDSAAPDDIGFSQGFSAIPQDVLASTFNVSSSIFSKFHKQAPLIMPDSPPSSK